MISVIKTDSGNYNVVGIRDDMFVLQGNLTLAELKKLKSEVDSEVKKASK